MKENLEDFYIPYRKTLDLPKNVTFGLEVEFKRIRLMIHTNQIL